MPSYADRLHHAILAKGTPALVGLDPRLDLLPESVLQHAQQNATDTEEVAALAFEEFCKRIIDVVAPLVPAVKPQSAFFEQAGPAGVNALQRINQHARRQGLIVICDAKRGDIGSTAEAYAQAYLAGEDPQTAPFAADALTVNPYLGPDTLQPFLKAARDRGAGLYVLVRTSNPQAAAFQDHAQDHQKLFEKIAVTLEEEVYDEAQLTEFQYGCAGAVVGATYPDELRQLRQVMPHVPLLIPGYGAQGGGAADVAAAFDDRGLGALVNSSRGINFAFRKEPYLSRYAPDQWEQAIEEATLDMIRDLAEHTPAGQLRSDDVT